MRALVVYESIYGNTHAIATHIAAGLGTDHWVTMVPVTRASGQLVAGADLIVVGGPTHMHGLTTATSRRIAAETAYKAGSGLTLDPDADGPGLRWWLAGLGARDVLAACFDTRFTVAPAFTGRASKSVARLLTRAGYHLLVPPESFLVSKQSTLIEGEGARAFAWGALVGELAREAYAPASR